MADDPQLRPLDQTSLELASGERDLRGAEVVDVTGQKIGHVEALLVDSGEQKVRFLDIRGGGILGIGDSQRLVPVEAVGTIEDGEVRLSRQGSEVAAGPAYDPNLVEDVDYWDRAYAAYGYTPYWGLAAFPGFAYYAR